MEYPLWAVVSRPRPLRPASLRGTQISSLPEGDSVTPDSVRRVQRINRIISLESRPFQVGVLTTVVIIIATLWLLRDTISDIGAVGYPGVFFLSLLSSGGFIFPVPGVATACALSLTLVPAFVGTLNGVGETIGEMTGYAVGYGSRGAIERRRFYIKAKEWMERRGTLVLFVLSIVPNPIFDFVGIAAGSTRFPFRRFVITVFTGKILKGLIVSYSCSFGVSLLPWVN